MLCLGYNVWQEHLWCIIREKPSYSMFTIAESSRIMTCTSGLLVFSWEVTKSSKYPTRSDFEPLPSFPFRDNVGGYVWFSCSKNSSKFPLRTCDAMYSWENRKQSFLREVTSSRDFLFSRTGGRLKRGRLFFLMGSEMGFVWLTSHSLT